MEKEGGGERNVRYTGRKNTTLGRHISPGQLVRVVFSTE